MAVEAHDDSVSKLYVVPGVLSAVDTMQVMIRLASDVSVSSAAQRHHSSHSPHSSLFDLAHVAVTRADASVHFHILSRQHLRAHLGMVTWLKFAVLVSPPGLDGGFDVVY